MLQYNVPPHLLEAQEQTFIQHFQPKLNFPYIASHMKRAFRGIAKPSHNKIAARSGMKSIWAKLRRRHLPRNIAASQVWPTLCDLASNTKRRFDNNRELLRKRTPPSQLYALHKLSRNLPPPHHLPAGKAIATAMRKRKLPTPRCRLPTSIPFLSHPTLLRNRITARDSTLPFHPPTTTVVFARHPRIQDQLHNWRKAHRRWQPNHSPPCTCQQLKQQNPTHVHHDQVRNTPPHART